MLIWFLKVALIVYLGLGVYLYLAQRSFMYFPVAETHADDVAVEYFQNGGETLKVWVVAPGREQAVIYFGGNAEDVYANAAAFGYTLPRHTVYLVNYRGYGGSSGAPTEAGLFSDALSIHDTLRGRHAAISVIGRSLGSGVAAYLASERPLQRLILVTPLDSALAVARKLYPIYPIALLLIDQYRSVAYAPKISAPTLVVMAEHDDIIPRAHSLRLIEAFRPGLVEQALIPGAGHNGLSGHPPYWDAFARFLGD